MGYTALDYATYAAGALMLWLVGTAVYNVFFHPLRAVPGPFAAKLSRWWLFRLEMGGNPHPAILELHRRYGPLMRISPNEVSINDTEAFTTIYSSVSKFRKAEYFYRAFEDQGSNLFTMRDPQLHAQDRRLISHAFSRANIVQHRTAIYDKAAVLMERLGARVAAGVAVPLFAAFRCMTLDTISEFAFGQSTGALRADNFASDIFESIDKATHSVPFFQSFPLLREVLRWATYYEVAAIPNGFRELAHAAEAGFRQLGGAEGWTMFGHMQATAAKTDLRLSKDHLVAEAIVMFVAGTDTTAAALAIALHQLLQQPDLYGRLQAEIRTVMPTRDSRPPVEALDALPLLDACVKEGLRLSCPSRVRMPRTVPAGGWTWKGQYFPAGTTVGASPLYFLYDEEVFPDPTAYRPTRWLCEGDEKRTMLAYYYPFSRGTRQCIGQNLSLIEQKIVLAMFARAFDAGDVLNKHIDVEEAITIIIEDPLEVTLTAVAD